MGEKLICIVLILAVLPLASATTTEINVKTLPFHEVQLTPYDPDVATSIQAFERFREETDRYGDVTFEFSSNEPEFNIIVYVKDAEGKPVIYGKKYEEEYQAGEPIYLEIAPAGAKLVETPRKCDSENLDVCLDNETCVEVGGYWYNETCNEEAQVIEQQVEETVNETTERRITGLAVFEDSKNIFANKVVWYVVLGILVVGISLFVIRKAAIKRRQTQEFKPKTKPQIAIPQKKIDEEIQIAERKIEEAQAEIKRIKNQGRIEQMQRKIESDQKELEKLRRGD